MTDLELLQKTLDADKWYESEKKGRDVCGEFPFCVRCERETAYPCASAYRRFYAKDEKKPAKRAATGGKTPQKRSAKNA